MTKELMTIQDSEIIRNLVDKKNLEYLDSLMSINSAENQKIFMESLEKT